MRTTVLLCVAFGLAQAQTVDFERAVLPVFAQRCQTCHGDQMQMAGLRLNRADASQGKVLIPGNSAASTLYQRVASDKKGHRMPPAGDPLKADEVAVIRQWIDTGATWPAGAVAQKTATNGHWSFQPIRKVTPPAAKGEDWAKNPIDRFILARLEGESTNPSPEADRNTLIRRVSLDLTGLPPTPDDVARFLADRQPDAYERMVDLYLASPHYGERWARYWLDLAHYADSDGYEKDLARPYAWRYRQWVIDAFNRDLPFNQFIIEQLAGDLLPSATVEQQVATGFLRQALTNREAGVDRAEARFEQLVNRTNTTGTVFLGLTVGCAQCHNHKFDPISRNDYYRLMAYFHSAEEDDIDAPLASERDPYQRALPDFKVKEQALIAEYDLERQARAWEVDARKAFENQGKDLEWDFAVVSFRAMFDAGDRFLKEPSHSPRTWSRFIRYFVNGAYNPRTLNDKAAADRIKEARDKLKALDASLPPFTQAMVMREANDMGPAQERQGGDYKTFAGPVKPGTIAALPAPQPDGPANRLGLAKWIAARDNPLTSRVMMNRLWQELFGAGLARVSEDFGIQGEKPSHPELLDWLAAEFVEQGWSWRKATRLILTSATYRQSSNVRPDLQERDPMNVFLARQNRVRLSAETIRDSALFAGGLLNTSATGGPSVKPPQPPGVAELVYGGSFKWNESTGPDRYRRGMYIHYQRTAPYPLLATFDAPDASTACSRRRRSNSPLQALNLLNDVAFVEAAEALAKRASAAGGSVQDRLNRAFELCFARQPSPTEAARLGRYLADQTNSGASETAAWTGLSRVLLNLDEFINRE